MTVEFRASKTGWPRDSNSYHGMGIQKLATPAAEARTPPVPRRIFPALLPPATWSLYKRARDSAVLLQTSRSVSRDRAA